jgi:hypothetical protein
MRIQALLLEWAERRDTQALNEVIPLVQEEIRYLARRCLFGMGRAEIEEEVEDVLSELMMPPAGRVCRLVAPGNGHPRFWRLRVIRNALLARARQRSARNRGGLLTESEWSESDLEAQADLSSMRRQVQRVLPELEPTRQVAVAVALGIEPELGKEGGDLRRRVREALLGSLPGYRVLFPEGRGEDAWRKLVERGARDLRRALALEGSLATRRGLPGHSAAPLRRAATRPA